MLNSLNQFLNRLIKQILVWRIKNITMKQFVFFLSIATGITVGLAAALMKNMVYLIESSITFFFVNEYENYLYVLYPMIGILIVILILKYGIKRKLKHGISDVLYSISQRNSILNPHKTYSHIIGSSITVGFGGSVGLEGPSVITGAAIGSNLGRVFHLNYKERTLLMGCAVSAALAAIFKAPIAGVIFSLEVLMLDLTLASIVPLLAASVSGAVLSYLIFGQGKIYHFVVDQSFLITNIPYYIILGILCGLISVYYTKTYTRIDRLFERITAWQTRLIMGGLLLGIIIFIFPPLYGEGYQTINICLQGNYETLLYKSFLYTQHENIFIIIAVLVTLAFVKVIATSLTFGSGGIGGNFAPSLFTGATFGVSFALLINHFNLGHLHVNKFALVGMAGLIAGVSHAPLTAIFLIAEITGGYDLFIPLMIGATLSYVTTKYFMPNSIYTHQLAKQKILITHNKDKAALTLMRIEKVVETDYTPINANDTLGILIQKMQKSNKPVFPVTDLDNNLLGIVKTQDIREIMFNTELYEKILITDIMSVPDIIVDPIDTMENVAQLIQSTGSDHVPVVKNGKYIGFVSRAHVFSTYRSMLKTLSD